MNPVQVNEMMVTDTHASPAYAYDTTDGAQLTQRVSGVDAAFTVDGISMTSSSNSVMTCLTVLLWILKKLHLVL